MASWWKKDNELQGLNIGPASPEAKPISTSEVKPPHEEQIADIRSAPGFQESVNVVRERALALTDKMLEPGHTPEFIFTLGQPGPDPNKASFFVLPSSAGPVLLLFTNQYRALDYSEHVGVKQFRVVGLKTRSLGQLANGLSSSGFKSYAVDRCPRRIDLQVFPLTNLGNPRVFLHSLALVVSTLGLEAEILIRELIRTGEINKRVSILKRLVEHIDPSNPTAYLFLAFSAQETDKSLTDWALNRIHAFWPDYEAKIAPLPRRGRDGVEKWAEQVAKLTLEIGIQYGVLNIPSAGATS